jgi:hypothetical protein
MSAGPLQVELPGPHRPPPMIQMNAGSVIAVARPINTKPHEARERRLGAPSGRDGPSLPVGNCSCTACLPLVPACSQDACNER